MWRPGYRPVRFEPRTGANDGLPEEA
jgi:hypothetical protein